MLAEAVGHGFDARNSAVQIIRKQGIAALLNEIPRFTSDYTKRVYLEEAVKNGNLDAGKLQDVLKLMTDNISSDYEKSTFLINTAGASLNSRNTLWEAYFAAVGTIKSSYEHGRVLEAALKANPGNKEVLHVMLASAAKISSDYERANFLIRVAQVNRQDQRIRAALINAVKTISSDHERGRVLNVVYLNELE